MLDLSEQCRRAAQDPGISGLYRTSYLLEAQHWYTKAHNPEEKSYLEREGDPLVFVVLAALLVPVIAALFFI